MEEIDPSNFSDHDLKIDLKKMQRLSSKNLSFGGNLDDSITLSKKINSSKGN